MCSLHAFPALASLAAGCLGLNGPDTWVDDVVQLDRLPRPAVVLGGGKARLSGRLELGVDRGVSLAPRHSVHPGLHHSATLLCCSALLKKIRRTGVWVGPHTLPKESCTRL